MVNPFDLLWSQYGHTWSQIRVKIEAVDSGSNVLLIQGEVVLFCDFHR
ncbi:MAG: hypothetical protein IPG71_00225 [bacterium]|nr:hypothetical protein [bacterium]